MVDLSDCAGDSAAWIVDDDSSAVCSSIGADCSVGWLVIVGDAGYSAGVSAGGPGGTSVGDSAGVSACGPGGTSVGYSAGVSAGYESLHKDS